MKRKEISRYSRPLEIEGLDSDSDEEDEIEALTLDVEPVFLGLGSTRSNQIKRQLLKRSTQNRSLKLSKSPIAIRGSNNSVVIKNIINDLRNRRKHNRRSTKKKVEDFLKNPTKSNLDLVASSLKNEASPKALLKFAESSTALTPTQKEWVISSTKSSVQDDAKLQSLIKKEIEDLKKQPSSPDNDKRIRQLTDGGEYLGQYMKEQNMMLVNALVQLANRETTQRSVSQREMPSPTVEEMDNEETYTKGLEIPEKEVTKITPPEEASLIQEELNRMKVDVQNDVKNIEDNSSRMEFDSKKLEEANLLLQTITENDNILDKLVLDNKEVISKRDNYIERLNSIKNELESMIEGKQPKNQDVILLFKEISTNLTAKKNKIGGDIAKKYKQGNVSNLKKSYVALVSKSALTDTERREMNRLKEGIDELNNGEFRKYEEKQQHLFELKQEWIQLTNFKNKTVDDIEELSKKIEEMRKKISDLYQQYNAISGKGTQQSRGGKDITTNVQLDWYARNLLKIPGYGGTCCCDDINQVIPPRLKYINPNTDAIRFIMNTDKRSGVGKHWVAFNIDLQDGSLEYFDPLGQSIRPEVLDQVTTLIRNDLVPTELLKLKVNSVPLQKSSSRCGYHSLRFLFQRANGVPFSKATMFDYLVKQSPVVAKSESETKSFEDNLKKRAKKFNVLI